MKRNQREPSTIPLVARPPILWWSVFASLVVVAVVAFAWYNLDRQTRANINRVSASTARSVEALIRQDLDSRVSTLVGLAQRWSVTGGTQRLEWQADAKNIFTAQPGYQAIEWADRSLRIRWIVPLEGNERAQDFDLRSNPDAIAAAEAARDSGNPVLTRPLELVQGSPGLVAYIPVDRSGQFDGLMVGVLEIDTWLGTLLPTVLTAEHGVSVSIDDQTIYSHHDDRPSVSDEWLEERRFDFYNLNIQVDVLPRADFLSLTHSRFSKVMLVAGLLLSSLAAVTVYFVLTSRYRAQQVRDNARHLELLFKNLPGMAYRCSGLEPWPMEFVSDGCEALCEYRRSDLEEQRVFWGDLIHPDDKEDVVKSIRKAGADRQPFEIEYRIGTRSGMERWMWERGTAINNTDGKETVLEGFITDVTEMKESAVALQVSDQRFRAVFDQRHQLAGIVSTEGILLEANQKSLDFAGLEHADVIGRHFWDTPWWSHSPELQQRLRDAIKAAALGETVRFEATHPQPDGHMGTVDFSLRPITDGAGQIVFIVPESHDISEQRLAEEEAKFHRERLAHVARLNTLGEMAAGIAHEINQPLTAISLFAQAGKRLFQVGKHEKMDEVFDKLSEHALRAGAVIERMQTMARQGESAKEIIDCKALIENVVKLAESEARIHDITIDVAAGKALPLVAVDTVQIQQVILNLLRNGMEAMRSVDCRDGNTITVQTQIRDDGDIEVAVIDTGCGVSEAVAKKLFTPFSTTKESGMGMGLSISRAIIIAHGGQLGFHNNESGGATFSFTLPAATQGDQDG